MNTMPSSPRRALTKEISTASFDRNSSFIVRQTLRQGALTLRPEGRQYPASPSIAY
jgi:hypothetical protein